MSMMTCTKCGAYVDTDDGTGVFEDKGTRFWCEDCLQKAVEEMEPGCPILAAYSKQSPEEYAELLAMQESDAAMESHRASFAAERAAQEAEQDLIDAGRGHLTKRYAEQMNERADFERKRRREEGV